MYRHFEDTFNNLRIPVIVCREDDSLTVVYGNMAAMILTAPAGQIKIASEETPLSRLLAFKRRADYETLRQTLITTGVLNNFKTELAGVDNQPVMLSLMANRASYRGETFFALYFLSQDANSITHEYEDVLYQVLNASFHAVDLNEAIQAVISVAGNVVGVSRVYIFEDLHNEYTRNTYEWCAQGVTSAIADLQNLRKDEYVYDQIMDRNNPFICENVDDLPEESGREVLAMQGIRSLALIPMYMGEEPVGYVGFDDCEKERGWSRQILQFLYSIASILTSLIGRRNDEKRLKLSFDVLQIITDSTDSAIYVTALETYDLIFINRALLTLFNAKPEDLIGKKCWRVLQKDMTGPCPNCPINHLIDKKGDQIAETYESEVYNSVINKWFLAWDSIIRWTDGSLVHIENAVDITYRKQYEEQLHHYASTDIMTGTFNREWGYRLLHEARESARFTGSAYTLCFFDVDGLKAANDLYGHHIGDDLLRNIIEVVRACVRKNDLLCRWGGDEFLLLVNCPMEDAQRIIEKIKAMMDEINASKRHPYTLSFSLGMTNFTAHDSIDAAVSEADQLMYVEKSKKKSSR